MTATYEDISGWFDRGVKQGATHMLVVCDTFDYDDYPVFAYNEAEARQHARCPGEMQRVMEVYNLKLDKQTQLDSPRTQNF